MGKSWARRLTAGVENNRRRDEVPGFLRDDVAAKKSICLRVYCRPSMLGWNSQRYPVLRRKLVDFTWTLTTRLPKLRATSKGGISPGLEDRVTAAKGFGDELGFHPFAAFLVVSELGHAAPGAIAESIRVQKKRRGPWAAPFFDELPRI